MKTPPERGENDSDPPPTPTLTAVKLFQSNQGFPATKFHDRDRQSPATQHPAPAVARKPAAERHAAGAMGGAGASADGGRISQGRPPGAPGRRGNGAVLHPGRHGQARGLESRGPRDDPALRRGDRDGHLVRRLAPAHPDPLLDRRSNGRAHRRTADAAVGRVPREIPERDVALRIRGDEADVGSDGAHHHAAPARCARASVALPPQAPGSGGADPEERTRRLPQPDAGNPFTSQAEARRSLEISRDSSGQNSRNRARPVIEPTSALEKNTDSSPCDASIACRNAASARSPSTMASTSGASGKLSFLN